MMIDPVTALTSVGATLKIIDSLTGQWDRFFKRPETSGAGSHSVTAERQSADVIVLKRHGQLIETITASDLARLDAGSRALIKTIEESMQRDYELWCAVYPHRNDSTDPIANAKVERQLNDIAGRICSDLGKIFSYLDSLGKNLSDHYNQFRFLCTQIAGPSGGNG